MKQHRGEHEYLSEWFLFIVLLFGSILMLWWVGEGEALIGREGVIRVGIGQDLLKGLSRGRQGLVDSLRWAPLPTLIALPLLRLPEPFGGDWAPVVVGVGCAALLAAFLSGWLKTCGMGGPLRLAIAVLVFLSPALQDPLTVGGSEPVFLLLVVLAFCFLVHWWETDQLRSLAYLALCLALAILTRYASALLFGLASVFVIVHLVARRKQKHYAEATLIVFLVPALYAIGLWIASNWLIMGDPFHFVRNIAATEGSAFDPARLFGDARLWGQAALLCAIPFVARRMRGLPPRFRPMWSGLVVAAACLLLTCGGGPRRTVDRKDAELSRIVKYLAGAHREDWIIYSGHRGYELARALAGRRIKHLHHTLSFYPQQVLERTRGKRTYLLVPMPRADGSWEQLPQAYPDIFGEGGYEAVFERAWDDWLLVRIVRLDETDRM